MKHSINHSSNNSVKQIALEIYKKNRRIKLLLNDVKMETDEPINLTFLKDKLKKEMESVDALMLSIGLQPLYSEMVLVLDSVFRK